jgi:DNA-binding winged helix-turn-helix (wHTH) protein/tetratricopeptide (TPR) repeat protein
MPRDVNAKIYEFKGFRLEEDQRRLLYGGQAVALKPKIFDLLLYLVEMRGQLVAKEELMKEIWPDTIVEENNLTVSMSTLRKTLGDTPGNPEFIETVPRRGYRFLPEVIEKNSEPPTTEDIQRVETETTFQEELIDSLAVLPMQIGDSDPNIEYLSQGITESITDMLSRIPRLRVLASSTVFRFIKKDVDPQAVGLQLNVRAVMTIRVNRLEDKLIVRSELVKVSDGSQLWGEQYNRSPSDILAIQHDIARAITESLKFKLSGQEQISLTKQPTDNNDAYHLYLRGRFFWKKYTKEWVLKAKQAFEQAIQIDSHYALAYCGLADTYFRLSNVHFAPREVLPKAKEAALKAVEIDDNLAEAHSSLALVHVYYDQDWIRAEREYRRALELNPNLILAHQRYASYLTFMGRFEEALRHYETALEIDPLSLQSNMNVGSTYYLRGEYDRAVEHLKKTLELDPNYMPTHFVMGCVYIQKGCLNQAIEEFKISHKLEEQFHLAMGFMGYAHALNDERDEALTLLNILEDASKRMYVSPYCMLVIHLALGPEERVFELLDQLYEERNDWLVWLKVSPELKGIRSKPRFKELLKRVGFPD